MSNCNLETVSFEGTYQTLISSHFWVSFPRHNKGWALDCCVPFEKCYESTITAASSSTIEKIASKIIARCDHTYIPIVQKNNTLTANCSKGQHLTLRHEGLDAGHPLSKSIVDSLPENWSHGNVPSEWPYEVSKEYAESHKELSLIVKATLKECDKSFINFHFPDSINNVLGYRNKQANTMYVDIVSPPNKCSYFKLIERSGSAQNREVAVACEVNPSHTELNEEGDLETFAASAKFHPFTEDNQVITCTPPVSQNLTYAAPVNPCITDTFSQSSARLFARRNEIEDSKVQNKTGKLKVEVWHAECPSKVELP